MKEAYPDSAAFDPKDPHYDPKSKKDLPAWFIVDIKFVKKLIRPVSIGEIKANKKLGKMSLIQRGNRLSVTPVTKDEFEEILKMSNS